MPQRNGLPSGQGMLCRPRLRSLIRSGLRHPLLVMLAGPGYGKTQAMADYLTSCDDDALWLRLGALDNLPAHFWEHLLRSLRRGYPDLFANLQGLGFPDTPFGFGVFRQLLAKELRGRKETIWVFDDFGEIADRSVEDFFRRIVGTELKNFHIVLISNALAATESVAFLGGNRALVLAKDLRFTRAEIAELYRAHGLSPEDADLDGVERHTEGWPLPVHLLALQGGRLSDLESQGYRRTHHIISRMFEERFFSNYSEARQKGLVALSLLDSFTRAFAADLCEAEGAESDLLDGHAFISNEPTAGRYFFHHLYRTFLQKKKYLLGAEEERGLWRKAAEHSAASGDAMEAVACYRRSGDRIDMLNAIAGFAISRHGVTEENAAFFLEHLDLLTADEVRAHPIADVVRALAYMSTLQLERAEALLSDLEERLPHLGTADARALLGEVYILRGFVRMTSGREDFGDDFERSAGCLPEGSRLKNRSGLRLHNGRCFFMSDSLPGAKERMEQAVHRGVPLAARLLDGCMSGMEHLFSAELSYLSGRFDDARRHAARAIREAESNSQHDIACNGRCILARIALMQGNFAEMSAHVRSVAEYAGRHESASLQEIRDTALAWYHIKLRDRERIPKDVAENMFATNRPGRPAFTYGRSQVVYAECLLDGEEYTRLVGMLEYPGGVFVSGGVSSDRIYLYIVLAIAHDRLGNEDAAAAALWAAYDLSHRNGLTTPFVEAERPMCALIDKVRRQRRYAFADEWLDSVRGRAEAFARRANAVRTAYKRKNPPQKAHDSPLTRREAEVLRALSRGMTREEIAVGHFVSVNTVKTFIRSIYNKLDAANRAEAVSIAIANGYIENEL